MNFSPTEYYQNRIKDTQTLLNRIRKQIYTVGTFRLFIVVAVLIGAFLIKEWTIIVTILLIAVVPFLFFMVRHDKLFRKKNYYETVLSICTRELEWAEYRFDRSNSGSKFQPDHHDFSHDLDLFGPKSLYAYMERSATSIGNRRFIRILLEPLTDMSKIINRQQAVIELAAQPDKRVDFLAKGKMNKGKDNTIENLDRFVKSDPIITGPILRTTVAILPFVYLLLIGLSTIGAIPINSIFYLFLPVLIYTFIRAKYVTGIQNRIGNQFRTLNTYADLIRIIEESRFEAPLLQQLNQSIRHNGTPVSARLQKLNRLIANLDQRAGVFGWIMLNGFLLWDFRQLIHIEQWRKENAPQMKKWFETVAEFDALCTLGTFYFNHPDYQFPKPVETDQPVLEAEQMGHPLIPPHSCIRNDVRMSHRPAFLVITGANMAGKSTYLRTIGINWLLASIGAPVCAKEMVWTPCTLFTSLRTTDSLIDNESYFFAELKRLKEMVDRMKKREKMFVILDEILKGTNSTDKQKGSMALVRQLIELNATGVIATHDLLLGSLADNYPGQIENFRFEADIIDDELTFSYRIQPGIAQNMNAFFLMKKMGIVPKETGR